MTTRDLREGGPNGPSSPSGWWADRRTVGLLMAGLFGIVTIGFAFRAGSPAA